MLDAPSLDNPALAHLLNTKAPWEAASPGHRMAVHEPIKPAYVARRKKAR